MEAHYPENHALASIDRIESSQNILHFCRIQEVGTGNTEKIVFPAAKAHMDPKKDLTIDLSKKTETIFFLT
jgi:hypothetical protein